MLPIRPEKYINASVFTQSPLLHLYEVASQWEDIKLVDVDKLSLPQDTGTFISKIPWRLYPLFVVVILLGLLIFCH